MFADKLIIQVLEESGELSTTIIRDRRGEPLLVDYPRFGRKRSEQEQAFSIFSDKTDLEIKNYIKENIGESSDFFENSEGSFEFHQEWINVPIDRGGGMGLYCLVFPEYAALQSLNICLDNPQYDSGGKVLLKDPDFHRYLLYLRLKNPSNSHCSFDIQGKFVVNDEAFLNSAFEPSTIRFIRNTSSRFGNDTREIQAFQEFFKALKNSTDDPSLSMVLEMAGVNSIEREFVANLNSIKRGIACLEVDKISILFLSSDPTDASRLRLGEESREIQEKLQLAQLRERFVLNQRMSVRPTDISQALLDLQPQFVHFSGHGTNAGALCFEDKIGKNQPVEPSALAALFEQFSSQVSCVILNACYSEAQAKAIAKHIQYVIGMNKEIGDKAAIAFATGFYQALGAGRTVEDAYKLGRVQIQLQGIPESLTPVLIKKRKRKRRNL